MMQSNAEKREFRIYYMDFRAISAGAITKENIKNPSFSWVLKATRRDCEKIVSYIDKKDYSGKLDNQIVRLFVPRGPSWSEYFVDQNGRVLSGTEEYVIAPYFFLKLNDHLDYLKVQNGIREGSPLFGRPVPGKTRSRP